MKTRLPTKARGFTLLEVMFAVIAFCTATFAILALVSQSLEEARRLQRPMVDTGLVAADVYAPTNQLIEGEYEGNLSDFLGDDFQNYDWSSVVAEVNTNKFYQVDIVLKRRDTGAVISEAGYLFYKPLSPAGSMDGATVAR
ncbi:MAG TPA: hypothetical protein VGI03_10855 [Verrucomicrobiae bacterium]|jgi:hypothetical protein